MGVYTDQTGANPFRVGLVRILDGRQGDGAPWHQMAIVNTALLLLACMAVSLLIGILVASLQLTRWRVLQFIGRVFVEAVRGIPIYVMLLFVYFGVRSLLRDTVTITPFMAAVASLGVCYGAYMAEVVRAGILAIPPEEIEAASLEGRPHQVLAYVVLPQALRTILPALANECIALLKDSAVVGVITVVDITRTAHIHAGSTFRYFETFSALALIYLLLSLVLSRVQRSLERWSALTS
jgi:polar amino acid transport system permease protein